MGLSGVISNLLFLSSKLLPVVIASAQASSSSSFRCANDDQNHHIEAELGKLMRMLERIKATLYDAEQREIRDKSVELWLKELKEVAYEAEDILDEYHYEVLSTQVEARDAFPPGSRKRKLIQVIIPKVPDGMFDQIQQIRNKFAEIENDRIALRLLEEDGRRNCNIEFQVVPTTHIIDASGIFGRVIEKKKLIDLLSSDSHEVVSVVAIVGTGGLGKTTLAQLVYNDQRIRQRFDKFGWICVSDNFNVESLTKESVESISGNECGLTNLSALQERTREVIRGKKLLLVLDDVWNEKRSLWESFCAPFMSASFAKIVVTTRNEHVARIMQTVPTFYLDYLSADQSWRVFEHYAFRGVRLSANPALAKIGKQIVKKCGMLPLAVKSIASLLRLEMKEESWKEILQSELWESDARNEIFPPLHLSYARLPTYLKPCFLYCSMFPKDYKYNSKKMVQLWISQGYIESKGKKNAEEIGYEYIRQLLQRSFFESHNRNLNIFKLHDMFHDLARLISKNACCSIEGDVAGKLPDLSNKVYHLYIADYKKSIDHIPVLKFKALRTLIIEGQFGDENSLSILNLSIVQKLRALEIHHCSNLKLGYISSINNLKHLRHLSLCDLPFKRLPECISSLYNLQILKLKDSNLNELPTSMGNLVSLEMLEIERCKFLDYLPESLCQLKALRKLCLYGCEQLEELPTNIGNLVRLEELVTKSCGLLWLPESFCQLKALKKLDITECEKLEELPENMENLVSLGELLIVKCHLLTRLPKSFCQLESLRELTSGFNGLEELPGEMGSLTNLQSLKIFSEEIGSLLPSLGKITGIQTLKVGLYCQKIGWLNYFGDLRGTLYLHGLKNISNLTDVQCANLAGMHDLEQLLLTWDWDDEDIDELFIDFHDLAFCLGIKAGEDLVLEDRNDFAVMASLHPHPNLRELVIEGYDGITFPEWIGDLSSCASLERLTLRGCSNITFLSFGSLCRLKYLKIDQCNSLQLLKAESLPLELEQLEIYLCEELISVPGIQELKSLVKLNIQLCDNLHSLVMDADPPVQLTMHTNESPHQKLFWGLRNLTSLRTMEIRGCRKLKMQADELLCVETCEVKLRDCPLLKKLCLQHSISYKVISVPLLLDS